MAATLDDIKKELINNRKVTDDILKTNTELVSEMTTYFKDLKEQARQAALNQKEKDRETKAVTSNVSSSSVGGGEGGGLGIFGIPALGGIKSALAAITGGILAIELALAGFRGWELKALKGIKNIGVNLKGKTAVFGAAIFTKIDDAFAGTRARILRLFGLGVDGKPIVVQGKGGKVEVPTFRKITNAISDAFGNVTRFINDSQDAIKNRLIKVPFFGTLSYVLRTIFSPITRLKDGVDAFFKGGSKLVTFMKGAGLTAIGSAASFIKPVAAIAGKVLLPLGVLLSAKKAFDEFFNSPEGKPLSEKLTDSAFAFLGDFIGAPLNLIKGGIVYILRTLLGVETDDDGNIIGKGFFPAILRAIKGFDFEKLIRAIPDLVMKIFDGIMDFLSDPIGVGKKVIGSIFDTIKELFFQGIKALIGTLPGGKAIADKFFRTDEQKIADLDTKVAEAKSQLGDMTPIEMKIAKLAEAKGIEKATAFVTNTYLRRGETLEDRIASERGLIYETLAELSRERTALMQEILIGNNQPSVVSAPTNNISNVNQGFTLPFQANHDDAMVPGFR